MEDGEPAAGSAGEARREPGGGLEDRREDAGGGAHAGLRAVQSRQRWRGEGSRLTQLQASYFGGLSTGFGRTS